MIEKLGFGDAFEIMSNGVCVNQYVIVDKINELIEAVNKLNKERKD